MGSGILDFGDSIYSCTVFEPAVAAGYYSLGQEDPMLVLCSVLQGYTRAAPGKLSRQRIPYSSQITSTSRTRRNLDGLCWRSSASWILWQLCRHSVMRSEGPAQQCTAQHNKFLLSIFPSESTH